MTTPYANDGTLGVNFASIFTPDTTLYPYKGGNLPNFPVGQMVRATNGSVWTRVLLGTGGLTDAGYVCTFNSAFTAVMMSNDTGALGDKIGVPACGVALAGDYIWLQVYGTCDAIRVAASCVANAALASTTASTPGVLDDAVGSLTKNLSGIFITTTATTAAAKPGELNFPVIGSTN